ncbi:hypothetical protein Tco_1512990, partial [Tanacetum coccineum]
QPLPPVDSPTAESLGYVTESDPEEDPKEYKDDDTEDGPVDYMDGRDDGEDDDNDSSGDDAIGEDEDDEDKEEEHYLAPADSTIFVFVTEPVFRPETSISLPPEAEVERLLAMTTPSPSPPISLSPPSAGERLVRSITLPTHLSPLPMPSPLLPSSGCPTQIQTLRIASTQALIDAVTAALPSPSLPPLPPSLHIPPPVDRSRYEVRESSTARPTRGQGIDYGFVSTVDVEERVTELAELHEHDTQDLYALLEDAQDIWMVEEDAYASREAWAHSIGLSQETHQEIQTHRDHVYAHETHLQAHQTQLQLQSTLIQTQHQAELLALRGQQRRARQPGPEARVPDHQDAFGDVDSHI